jgi:SAM-dependent methyltransferase
LAESDVSDKAADIDVYYGKRAFEYDEIRMKKEKWFEENAAVDKLLEPFARKKVLDVPVGTGRYVGSYTKYDQEVIGVDVSMDMMREAFDKFEGAGIEYELVQGSILEPLPPADIAVCTRLFNHLTLDECRLAMKNMITACEFVIIGLLEPPPDWYDGKVKWTNRHKLSDVTEGLLTQREESIVIENKRLADYKITRLRRVD